MVESEETQACNAPSECCVIHFLAAVAQHKPESTMEEEVAALLQSAGAASSKAVAESEDKLAMKV